MLGYDAGDALEQAVAERVAVNAREAGIPWRQSGRRGMLRQPREGSTPGWSACACRRPHPGMALARFFARRSAPLPGIDPSSLADAASPEQIYDRERAIVNSYRVVPSCGCRACMV